jgi:hypothetical protein
MVTLMTDNRMTQWRSKLRDSGGVVLQVNLSKDSSNNLNEIMRKLDFNKKDTIEFAIASLLRSIHT